ncbi:MAG: hypothetical protein WBA22_03060 [Candidatus Methanofastidiosia archaeon]
MRSREYQEEIAAIIRKLERANELTEKTKERKSRSYILYFLGYLYYSSGDMFTAKKKLRECVELKSGFAMEETTLELLDYIWTYEIRPIWWRWWLSSPLYCLKRKILFFVLLLSILLILVFNPFIPILLPRAQVDWYFYILLATFLILILLSPNIRKMKVGGLEVELSSPPPPEPRLSPLNIEKMIEEMPRRIDYTGSTLER